MSYFVIRSGPRFWQTAKGFVAQTLDDATK